jgi:hypothetical protein
MEFQQTPVKEEFPDIILQRLLEHYLTHEPIPGKAETIITGDLVHRLYRYAVAEGYGQ